MRNYISLIGRMYPDASVYCTGDPTNYNHIVWNSTQIPKETLDSLSEELDKNTGSYIYGSTTLTFIGRGNQKNKWLGLHSDDISSNETVGVIPYYSRLGFITMSNSKNDIDADIEIRVGRAGNPNDSYVAFSYNLTTRTLAGGRDDLAIFNQGDLIGVWVGVNGPPGKKSARNLIVTLGLEQLSIPTQSIVSNSSSNL